MFYVLQLTHSLVIPPIHFGPKLYDTLTTLLRSSVEGSALSTYGYVVQVISVPRSSITAGVIEYDSGDVAFDIRYEALLFRPFKNEVVDAVVTDVNNLGFFAYVGPLRVFVSERLFPGDLNGVEGGGYDGDSNSWISADNEVQIKDGCGVRVRIIGTTVEENDISSVGRIDEDFLGLIDNGDGAVEAN